MDLVKLAHAGYTKDEIENIMGRSPVWIGYGLVRKSELSYIKMTPHDLAKKRAEANATKQRFDLPFNDEMIADDIAPDDAVIGEIIPNKNKNNDTPEGQLDLEIPPAQPQPAGNGNGKAPMTLKEAKAITNRDGTKYGDISPEDLKYMARSLSNVANRTVEQEDKLLAIQLIQADRSKPVEAK